MATHSSILAWETPWTEEPGRLQFLGLQRVGHNLATKQQQPQDNQSQGMQHFVGIESCKSLGSLKSFLWYAPQLSETRVLFSHPEFLGLTMGSDCSQTAARWQVFFPSCVPSGLTSSPFVVSAIVDDCDILCLLIWQEMFHSLLFIFFAFSDLDENWKLFHFAFCSVPSILCIYPGLEQLFSKSLLKE